MNKINHTPEKIIVPREAMTMSPKELILLMRSLGVGKENFAPPFQARAWTTHEFLDACMRRDVIRHFRGLKRPDQIPERTTVDGWFSRKGPLPDDRRKAWHFFFHVFFSYERRAFGTQEWKQAYFDAIRRQKIRSARFRVGALPLVSLDI